LGRLDDDAALVLVVAPEADRAVDLGNDRVILRTTGLEQLGHTRQTAGDILGLGALERDTREYVAGGHLLAGLDRNNRIDREQIPGLATTIELDDGVAALDRNGRLERVVALAAAPIHDHTLGEAGGLVGRFRHGRAVDQVLERYLAFHFRQDGTGIGVPFGDPLATLDLGTVVDPTLGTLRAAARRPPPAVPSDA